MTRIKICGLSRESDIEYANELMPEFAGFVFAKESKRYIDTEKAARLRYLLDYRIAAVGVFVDDDPLKIADIADRNIIDMIQLHGHEDSDYIRKLRGLTDLPLIQAFVINSPEDILRAENSNADFILLDSGRGTGVAFDHSMINNITRPYFLAGGLDPENVSQAVSKLNPYAVDVSSGVEVNGIKSREKMAEFIQSVRIK